LYESALVLTNGGPGDSSLSIVMLIAEKSFTSMNYGQGTSLSMLLLILIGVVTSLNFWGSKKWVNYD
jgi:multiple sugar transport system permease protein